MQKKYVFFAIMLVGVLVLSGCTNKSDKNEEMGLEQPEDQKFEYDYADVRKYLTDHISEYAPEDPVLGGTWYVTDIRFEENKNRALIDYEDGHIAVKAIVDYRIESNNTVWVSAIPAYFDDREPVKVKVGDRFAIALSANPSTGFSWIGEDAENSSRPLSRMESGFISDASEQDIALSMTGIGGINYIIYDAVNSGAEKIKLTYQRPWESVQPLETKIFNVTVE